MSSHGILFNNRINLLRYQIDNGNAYLCTNILTYIHIINTENQETAVGQIHNVLSHIYYPERWIISSQRCEVTNMGIYHGESTW